MDLEFLRDLNGKHVHIVGVKGTGTSALAEICTARGARVTGSDIADVFYTDAILAKIGVVPTLFDAKNITADIDLVIHSSAYNVAENVELREAARLGIPTVLYTQALGELSASRHSVAVCGVHGKTTTTGIIGTVLQALNFPAQILAGSAIASFGGKSTVSVGDEYFVAETCEYQRHFMSFHPEKIVLTSVEPDHQDYYPTYQSIRDAFVEFAQKLPSGGDLIYCADDAGACEVAEIVRKTRSDLHFLPYGEAECAKYRLQFGEIKDGWQHFSVNDEKFAICVPGRHNVRNSAAAFAVSCEMLKSKFGKTDAADIEKIRAGLANFRGAKRRCEIFGEHGGVLFIDDYAHHPTAIRTTLAGIRDFYAGRRIVADFMSHTYSRTAALLDEFASAFGDADVLVLHKIYGSARETAMIDGAKNHVNGKTLFEHAQKNHRNVHYFEEILDAKDFLAQELRPGDIFVTLGAGDNWKIGEAMMKWVEEN